MNPIEQLVCNIEKTHPGVITRLGRPLDLDGVWFADLALNGLAFVVQWRERTEFGLTRLLGRPGSYGEGPDEALEGIAQVERRLADLWEAQQRDAPGGGGGEPPLVSGRQQQPDDVRIAKDYLRMAVSVMGADTYEESPSVLLARQVLVRHGMNGFDPHSLFDEVDEEPAPVERYLLKVDWQSGWQEVTKEDWIKAERNAGFHPKDIRGGPAYMTTCATGGFSGGGVSGRIEIVYRTGNSVSALAENPPPESGELVTSMRELHAKAVGMFSSDEATSTKLEKVAVYGEQALSMLPAAAALLEVMPRTPESGLAAANEIGTAGSGGLDLLQKLKAAVWMVGNMDTAEDKAAWWHTFGAVWNEVSADGQNAQAYADAMFRARDKALECPVESL